MAPLVDVVLLLLIFFMLITRYMPPSLSVNLPEASAAQPDDHPSVMLSIDSSSGMPCRGCLTAAIRRPVCASPQISRWTTTTSSAR